MDDAEDELSMDGRSLSTGSDHGADVNSILEGDSGDYWLGDDEDSTPLYRAKEIECVAMAKLLVKLGADLEGGHCETPLQKAVMNGSTDVIRILLSSAAIIVARNEQDCEQTPLMYAVADESLEVVRFLLDVRDAFEARYKQDCAQTPLMYAVADESLQVLQLLLKFRSVIEGPGISGVTQLMRIVMDEDLDGVELLLKCGAAVDGRDFREATTLHYAASWPAGLRFLIGAGASVGARNLDGETALHLTKRVECIDLLLNGGLEIDARDKESMTALHKASQAGDKIVVEHLLKRGASPSAESFDGTPLHKVLSSSKHITNRFLVVQILLEYGADINARRPSDGMTPVHVGALGLCLGWLRDLGVLRLLCKHGADPYLIDNESKTAFYYLEGHEEGISVLRSCYLSQLWPQRV